MMIVDFIRLDRCMARAGCIGFLRSCAVGSLRQSGKSFKMPQLRHTIACSRDHAFRRSFAFPAHNVSVLPRHAFAPFALDPGRWHPVAAAVFSLSLHGLLPAVFQVERRRDFFAARGRTGRYGDGLDHRRHLPDEQGWQCASGGYAVSGAGQQRRRRIPALGKRGRRRGHAGARYDLGVMYKSGFGVQRNDALAMQWFDLAARQNHSEAQYQMALMYKEGAGVPIDLVKSYTWAHSGAIQGHIGAIVLRDNLSQVMTPQQVHDGRHAAGVWHAGTEKPATPPRPAGAGAKG
jgi:Sel1 repeat